MKFKIKNSKLKIAALLLALLSALNFQLSTAFSTPVFISLKNITGSAKADKFTVTADPAGNPLTDGTNLFGGFTLATNAPNGTNTIWLQPNGYTLAVPGWMRTLHFNVNDTTNVVNIVTLITNGLVSYSPVQVGNNMTATNVNLKGKFTLTDGLYTTAFNYPAVDSSGQARFLSVSNWSGSFSVDPMGNTVIAGKLNIYTTFDYPSVQIDGNLILNGDLNISGTVYGSFNGNGSGLNSVPASGLTGVVTNPVNSISGVITNGGVVWYFLRTNGVPAITGPSGSLCSTTNGQLYVRSNSVWLLK